MKKKKSREKFEYVGSITVDAGIIQVGDPCYQFQDEDWGDYLEDNKIEGRKDSWVIPHDRMAGNYGMYAKAVVVTSGLGDGVYDVEVKKCKHTGLVKEMRIKFL